jgi:hypothetical protein
MTGSTATQPWGAGSVRLQDRAYTAEDQRLLTQVRRQILPVLNTTEATSPVRLITQNGVVTLVGSVPTAEQRQRIVSVIERTPGVRQVVDQLQVGSDTSTMIGSAGVSGSTIGTSTGSVAGATTSFGTNLTPTSRIGATNRVFSGTNQLTNPQLTPQGDQTLQNRPNQGSLPPGLQNRDQLPRGLQDRDQLPPALERRENTGSGTASNPSSR